MKHDYEKIDISNEKVNKIIQAAFEVFALNDLEKASTNSVVKRAGVSRGLLYHYFEDKQDLFDFLVHFSVKEIVTNMQKKMDWEDTDFLNRIRNTVSYKFEVMDRYPYMLEFFNKYSREVTTLDLQERVERISPGINIKVFSYNLDFTDVRPGVDVDMMIKVVRHTLSGAVMEHWHEARAKGDNLTRDDVMHLCDEYIEFFRKQFFIETGASK